MQLKNLKIKIRVKTLKRLFFCFILGFFLLVNLSEKARAEDSIEWFDHGNVQIGFLGKGITAGGNLGVSLKNEGQYDLDYEIKLVEPGSTNAISKLVSIIRADSSLGTHVSVNKAGAYTAQVNLYYTGHVNGAVPNYSETYRFSVTDSKTPPAGAQQATRTSSSNSGATQVSISSPDRKINAGDNFRVYIENPTNSQLNYEINVDNLKTGQLVKKYANIVEAKQTILAWVAITSSGNHRVVVNLLNPKDSSEVLDQQSFTVTVADSSNTNKTSDEQPAGSSSASQQPTTHSTNGKVNPSLGDIFQKIWGNDPADANLDSVNRLIKEILNYAFNFAGIVAFIMVLWAARMFFNSYGSDETAAMAKKTLTWALVGLCVIIVSKAILLWIYGFLSS